MIFDLSSLPELCGKTMKRKMRLIWKDIDVSSNVISDLFIHHPLYYCSHHSPRSALLLFRWTRISHCGSFYTNCYTPANTPISYSGRREMESSRYGNLILIGLRYQESEGIREITVVPRGRPLRKRALALTGACLAGILLYWDDALPPLTARASFNQTARGNREWLPEIYNGYSID